MIQQIRYVVPFLVVSLVLLWLSCERPTSPPHPNSPPDTRLANIPKDTDTVFALVTLNWSGGDDDGFIARYQYRCFTYHLVPGTNNNWALFDSTSWTDTTASSVTIAFNSTEPLNRQRFLVRAIDNDGDADPSPAEKILYTTRTAPPITRIATPIQNAVVLVVDHVTDWWSGVPLVFSAVDPTKGGKVVDYAWSADGGPWNWLTDTSLYIPPNKFKPPLDGMHTIKVTSRNNTNLVDPIGDSVSVRLMIPPFDKKVLIIDETDEFNNPFITFGIQDSTVDQFYADVFPGSVSWDFKKNGMPPREVLGQYKILVWHADDVPAVVPHKISDPRNIAVFTDYLKVGGKFLMSGWRILKSFAYYSNFPFTFPRGTFVYDYLHIYTVDETQIMGDCLGGVGKPGSFSDFSVDSARLAFFPYDGKLAQVNLITKMAGFTEILYSYKNADNSPFVTYRGRPIALRYYGTVFDAVVLGFPMYFIRKDDAKVMAREILQSLHVN
ncbi:MAG: hypothetical protein FJ217_04590 [Ignavibacteria bacterium]|nr:hypothetical protein [Ignavibacteria bacterium]